MTYPCSSLEVHRTSQLAASTLRLQMPVSICRCLLRTSLATQSYLLEWASFSPDIGVDLPVGSVTVHKTSSATYFSRKSNGSFSINLQALIASCADEKVLFLAIEAKGSGVDLLTVGLIDLLAIARPCRRLFPSIVERRYGSYD